MWRCVRLALFGVASLLILPASRKISLANLKSMLGAKSVRLLSENEIAFLFPDCEVGSIPPFRHWSGTELWMDLALQGNKELLFQGGNHETAIRMPFDEWREIAKPNEGAFSIPSDWGGIATDEWRDEKRA